MSHRVRASFSFLTFALALAGCGSARTFELTVDGAPVDDADVTSSATLADATGRTTLEVRVNDPAPPGVTDGGIAYVFRIDLAPGSAAGDVLDLTGHATLTTDASPGPPDVAFEPDAGSDEQFLGVFAWRECFCGSPGTFDEAIVAHVEIVQVTETTITFSIDLEINGVVPGSWDSEGQLELRGTFTATRPTR